MFGCDWIRWLRKFSNRPSPYKPRCQHRRSYTNNVKKQIDLDWTEPTIRCNRWRSSLSVNRICRDNNKYIDPFWCTRRYDRHQLLYPLDKHNRVHNLFGNLRNPCSFVGSCGKSLDMKLHIRCRPCHSDMSSDNDRIFASWHGCSYLHNRVPRFRKQHTARILEHLRRICLWRSDLVCTLRRWWYRSRHGCMFWTNRMDHGSADRLSRQLRSACPCRKDWFGKHWLRTRSTRVNGVDDGVLLSLTPLSERHSLPKLVTDVLKDPSGSSRSSRKSFQRVKEPTRETSFTVTSIGVGTTKTSDLFHVRLFHGDVDGHCLIPFTTDTVGVT